MKPQKPKNTGFRGIGAKILIIFISTSLLAILVVALFSIIRSSGELKASSFNQLAAIKEIKKNQIEQYFIDRRGDMSVLIETVGTLRREAFAKLTAIQTIKSDQIQSYFDKLLLDMEVFARSKDTSELYGKLFEYHNKINTKPDGPYDISTPEYHNILETYGENMLKYCEDNGIPDLYMICANHGHVMYSCTKGSDLGTNLGFGTLKDSNLAALWKKVKNNNGRAVVDFVPYAPENGKPVAFAGAPIHDAFGRILGIMAVQVPIDGINNIMMQREGRGETGESYLVGPDKLMRSDSYADPVYHSFTGSFKNPEQGTVDTTASREALAGNHNRKVIADYLGSPVLSAYDPLRIEDITWAIISEIDIAEAFSPIDENGVYFYEKYMNIYGYYDLFLLNPDGYCFYSVTKEADYQTNFISGPYKDSSLSDAVKETLQTKQIVFSDFSPYQPSGGVPAAFLTQPVLNNGTVEMIVALQLPLEGINSIMQERTGMGESGESYLVGQDNLMRSDSFLTPETHSVLNSFKNPSSGRVDTDATREAFKGNSAEEIIDDYTGSRVLSAYTPVTVYDTTWALLAEINESEINAPINSLIIIIVIIAVGVLALVIAAAIFFSRTISIPIKAGVEVAEQISSGNLNLSIDKKNIERGDEVGQLSEALQHMINRLTNIVSSVLSGTEQIATASEQLASGNQDLSNRTEQQASALEETSSAIEEMNSSIRSNADNTGTADQLSRDAVTKTEDGSQAVSKMITSMNEISESSTRIADIIEVINNIAFQTNLLALNASIEAARAGEQGKGFAVVAVEVRKLAKRSDRAAGEITEIIKNSNKKVEEGVEIASTAGNVLSEINTAVKKVTALIGEISAASREQLSSVDEIDKTLANLDENTQKNAALVEEAASSTEELSAQAQELNTNMNFFKLEQSGKTGSPVRKKRESEVSLIEEPRNIKQVPEKPSKDKNEAYETFSVMADEGEFDEF